MNSHFKAVPFERLHFIFLPINFLKYFGANPKPGLIILIFSLDNLAPLLIFLVTYIDLLKIMELLSSLLAHKKFYQEISKPYLFQLLIF